MIVLDTNVVSELMRDEPDPRVEQWVAAQLVEELWMSAMTLLEIERGLLRCFPGKAQEKLRQRFVNIVDKTLPGQIVPLGAHEATHVAGLLDSQARRGRPVTLADAIIAGSAIAHNALVATRDAAVLEALGNAAVNPWARTPGN